MATEEQKAAVILNHIRIPPGLEDKVELRMNEDGEVTIINKETGQQNTVTKVAVIQAIQGREP